MDDLVDAIGLAVDKRNELPRETVLLIGEPKTLSYDALQRKMGKLLFGKEWITFSVPKWFAKIGAWVLCHLPGGGEAFIRPWMVDLADDHYELDVSRAKRLLGWVAKRTLGDTLPKMIDLLKKDPDKFYKINGLKK